MRTITSTKLTALALLGAFSLAPLGALQPAAEAAVVAEPVAYYRSYRATSHSYGGFWTNRKHHRYNKRHHHWNGKRWHDKGRWGHWDNGNRHNGRDHDKGRHGHH